MHLQTLDDNNNNNRSLSFEEIEPWLQESDHKKKKLYSVESHTNLFFFFFLSLQHVGKFTLANDFWKKGNKKVFNHQSGDNQQCLCFVHIDINFRCIS